MLTRVEITSFKSIVEARLELGAVNVLIGANGSGKSNILEALGVLGAASAGRVDDEGLLRRGVRPGVPALYKSSFKGSRARDAIRFGGFSEAASYEVELNNPTESPRPAWFYKTERLLQGNDHLVGRSPRSKNYRALNPEAGLAALEVVHLDRTAPAATLLDCLRNFAIFTPNTATLRGLVADPQSRHPVGLHGGLLPAAVGALQKLARAQNDSVFTDVIEDLHEMIDWVDAFGVRQRDHKVALASSIPSQREVLYFRDRFMADKRDELTGYDASEGALYVLFAAVVAVHPDAPPFLAVDNVDAGLNPRLARKLMESLCAWVLQREQPRQLLLTCHNPLVLDGLPLQDDRVRLFAVDRSRKGHTVVQRVEVNRELLDKANEGWPLSRLWVRGHIGGVPDV